MEAGPVTFPGRGVAWGIPEVSVGRARRAGLNRSWLSLAQVGLAVQACVFPSAGKRLPGRVSSVTGGRAFFGDGLDARSSKSRSDVRGYIMAGKSV
jgi:hypothetical protein